MLPLRSFSMTIVGLLACGIGIGAWISPAKVEAEYGAGWLYRSFGLAGVVGALLIFGVLFLLWGVLGILRAIQARNARTDITQ